MLLTVQFQELLKKASDPSLQATIESELADVAWNEAAHREAHQRWAAEAAKRSLATGATAKALEAPPPVKARRIELQQALADSASKVRAEREEEEKRKLVRRDEILLEAAVKYMKQILR